MRPASRANSSLLPTLGYCKFSPSDNLHPYSGGFIGTPELKVFISELSIRNRSLSKRLDNQAVRGLSATSNLRDLCRRQHALSKPLANCLVRLSACGRHSGNGAVAAECFFGSVESVHKQRVHLSVVVSQASIHRLGANGQDDNTDDWLYFSLMKKLTDEERQAVKARLTQLAEEKERIDGDSSHGRYARVQRFLESKGVKISHQSARKWFSGESVPSTDSAKLLAQYYRSSYLWILHGEGSARTAKDAATQESVPVYLLPLLRPSQLNDWAQGILTDPIEDHVEVFENFGPTAFAFTINDNSALPHAAKGMRAVVEPDASELADPVTSRRFIVVKDQNQFLVGEYSKTPYATITPPNKDFRPIELSDNHQIVGVLAALAQHKFEG